MATELRSFLTLPYDELEELNLKAKEQRRKRIPAHQLQEERIKYLSDEKGITACGDAAAASVVMPDCDPFITPLLYALPVQMLAYHVAVLKGTDVDQPRNLAKSVTVE